MKMYLRKINRNAKTQGFSLIELLIVVAVIAVLAAIAIPMYSNYLLRAHRADAVSSINLIAMNEEAWALSSGTYTVTLSDAWTGTTSTRGFYDMSLTSVTSSGYTIIATPIGSQTADSGDCPNLTLVASGGSITRTQIDCWE